MLEVLAACDCFVLASQSEGSPHSVLEALAMRRPVIATAVQGTEEFLTEGGHFRLVPWNDVAALGEAMLEFIRSPFPAPSPESLPRSWFDIPGQIRKLEEIYASLVTRVG